MPAVPLRPVLAGAVRDRCDEPVRAECAEHEWPVVALGIEPDHVRLFVEAHPLHSPLPMLWS
nr:transposase [Frankia gtarii]